MPSGVGRRITQSVSRQHLQLSPRPVDLYWVRQTTLAELATLPPQSALDCIWSTTTKNVNTELYTTSLYITFNWITINNSNNSSSSNRFMAVTQVIMCLPEPQLTTGAFCLSSITDHMPLLTAASTFRFREDAQTSSQLICTPWEVLYKWTIWFDNIITCTVPVAKNSAIQHPLFVWCCWQS